MIPYHESISLKNIIERVRFFFFLRTLRKWKRQAVFEAEMDKLLFEKIYSDLLSYDDSDDRKELIEQRKKPLKDQNEIRIEHIENKISKAKAVQQAYRKTTALLDEMRDYMKMLDSNSWTSRF